MGKNGDGIKENIKASFKFDNSGFGYKRKLNDWIEENNVYEQILADLSQQHGSNRIDNTTTVSATTSSTLDLEQRTRQSGRLQ